jgi:hypothetical protein
MSADTFASNFGHQTQRRESMPGFDPPPTKLEVLLWAIGCAFAASIIGFYLPDGKPWLARNGSAGYYLVAGLALLALGFLLRLGCPALGPLQILLVTAVTILPTQS